MNLKFLLRFILISIISASIKFHSNASSTRDSTNNDLPKVVYLKNKSFLIGQILEENQELILIKTEEGRTRKVYFTSIEKIIAFDPENPPVKYFFEDLYIDRLIFSPTGFEGGQRGIQAHLHSGIGEITLFPIKQLSISGSWLTVYPKLFYMYKAKVIFLESKFVHASLSAAKIGVWDDMSTYWAPALSIGTKNSFLNLSAVFLQDNSENGKGHTFTTAGYSQRLNNKLTIMTEVILAYEKEKALFSTFGSSLKFNREKYAIDLGLNLIFKEDNFMPKTKVNFLPRVSLHLLLNKLQKNKVSNTSEKTANPLQIKQNP